MSAVEETKKAYQYCEKITKAHARSFYFAAKFLPKQKRLPIYALYALCRQVDDEVDESGIENEREAAEAIENWKAKLDEVYLHAEEKSGQPSARKRRTKDKGRRTKSGSFGLARPFENS